METKPETTSSFKVEEKLWTHLIDVPSPKSLRGLSNPAGCLTKPSIFFLQQPCRVGTNPGAKHIDNPVYDNKNIGRLTYSGTPAKNPPGRNDINSPLAAGGWGQQKVNTANPAKLNGSNNLTTQTATTRFKTFGWQL